jgi:D-alanine-D-alanine ligase
VLHAESRFPFRRVVIIADLLQDRGDLPVYLRRDLEQTDTRTLEAVSGAIEHLGLQVCHYEHPKWLAMRASAHSNDVILSLFGGSLSRNRMALVPAICETFGLSYVGPDAYGRVICQDKEVSKTIASVAGLETPSHRIVRSTGDIASIGDFQMPYVVKPVWEGSSIGIGPDNLVISRSQGEAVLRRLFKHFDQPIMVEAFVAGREVSWCFIDAPGHNRIRSLAEVIWAGESNHFDRNLYDADHKLQAEEKRTIQVINDELRSQDSQAMERLLGLIGPIGYGRIDGKLKNGKFMFLEITPDAWLGPTGTFACSFTNLGVRFEEVIARILLSAQLILPNR